MFHCLFFPKQPSHLSNDHFLFIRPGDFDDFPSTDITYMRSITQQLRLKPGSPAYALDDTQLLRPPCTSHPILAQRAVAHPSRVASVRRIFTTSSELPAVD